MGFLLNDHIKQKKCNRTPVTNMAIAVRWYHFILAIICIQFTWI